jgi:hypothetical protein
MVGTNASRISLPGVFRAFQVAGRPAAYGRCGDGQTMKHHHMPVERAPI